MTEEHEALFDMCVQYCTVKDANDVRDYVFYNQFMSAGERAFAVLGIKNWETVGEAAKRLGYEDWY